MYESEQQQQQQQHQQPLFVIIIININISWQGGLKQALLSSFELLQVGSPPLCI